MDAILDVPCAAITVDMIAEALRPFWKGPGKKPGCQIRSLVQHILARDYLRRRKDGDPAYANPAVWVDNLDHFLSTRDEATKPHEAMPWKDVPAFFARISNAAMRFLILTSVRRGEVTGDNDKKDPKPPMDWSEIDLAAKLWTIPAERMKNGTAHVVPLTDAAIACLPPKSTGQVFPGTAYENGEAFKKLMKGTGATTHGFRSSFADWAIDTTGSDDLAQLCLSHKKGSKVERAYRRSTGVDQRRKLMEQWAAHVIGSPAVNTATN